MKILAIRLENLASLAGHHELDFTLPPLADQGLFAITGPTGAGKSTLLDALCLALYGNTPRLRQAPRRDSQIADVNDDTLTTADARTLLRRGCASGFAEVDFVGRDGRRYRARWSVRRARNKLDGSLQKAEQSLTDLDAGQLLTAQTREFEKWLPERLGLKFDQFTRAVLLAQSEFAAFLKADDNDRSALLERLTDTEHYSEISRAAYARVREARAALEAIDARLADALPADTETRAQLEQDASAEEKALVELQARIATHQREQTELEREAEMARGWREAESALREAESDCRARDDDRRTLEQLQALAPWRERAQRRQTLERALANRFRELDQARQALSEREREARTLATERLAAVEARDRAEADYHAEQPRLEEARQFGTALEHQQQRFQQRTEEQRQLAASVEDAQRQFEALTGELHRIERNLDGHRQAFDQLLAESSDGAAMPADTTPDALRADLNQRRDAAQSSLTTMQALEHAWQEAQRLVEEAALARRQLNDEQTRLGRLEQDGKQAKSALGTREAEARHISEQIERARAARSDSVERLRHLLRDDDPCPVCGGTDHPYLHDPAATPPVHPGEAMLEAIETQEREQLEDQNRQLDAARERHHQLGAEWRACRDGLKALEQQLATLEPRRQAAEQALDAHAEATLLRQADDPQAWLTDQREQSQTDYTRHGEWLARLDAIERQQRPLEAERQQKTLSLGKLEERLTLARQRLQELDDALPALVRARDESLASLRARLGEYPSVNAWQEALEQRRRQAQQQLESLQARWQTASQAQTQLEQQVANLNQRQREERQEFDELDGQWQAWRENRPTLSDERLDQLLDWSDAEFRQLGATLESLDRRRETARATRDERRRALIAQRQALSADVHDGDAPLDDATTQRLAERLEAQRQKALELERAQRQQQEQRDAAQHRLREDDRRRRAQQEGAREREAAERELNRWKLIGDLIGSADGKAFRRIAQAYNLDHLLAHANRHLRTLTPRYRLIRGGSELGILVIDGDMADERRSVHSLSGGETFLVSLALALGLASMASHQLAIESLFIDEGFGSLDPQSLALAMDALDGLQAQGRRVGVISHVQEMHERIPLQIRVEPTGNGASRVDIQRG